MLPCLGYCELLLETFRELFDQLAPHLNVSFSIGGAMAPIHGITYTACVLFS